MSAVTTRRGDFLFLNRAVWNPANWLLRSVFLLFSAFCLFIHFALIPNPFVYYQAVFFFFSYSVCVNIVWTIRCDECQPIRASPIGSSTSVVSGITVILVFWSQIWPYLDDRAGYGILTGSDWGSKPSFIMSFTLNKHHAAMKKTLNQWLRLWPYKITICWGNKSSEKYINFS